MRDVPIKFRGRIRLKGLDPSDINSSLNDGDYVYGGYARMKFLFEDDEGDLMTLEDYDYIAGVRPVIYSTDRETFRPNQDFSEYRLKEKNNE